MRQGSRSHHCAAILSYACNINADGRQLLTIAPLRIHLSPVMMMLAQAAKGVKAYDKAEDPIYALEHNLPIDFQHYLDHHLELPLTRLFGPVMNNPKELMTGMSHLLSA